MPNLADWSRYQEILDVIVQHNVQARVVVANLVKDRSAVALHDDLPADVCAFAASRAGAFLELIRQTYALRRWDQDAGVGGTFTS